MRMTVATHRYALRKPFVITGHVFETTDTVRVTLEHDGVTGIGENDDATRARVCQDAAWLGIEIDPKGNVLLRLHK